MFSDGKKTLKYWKKKIGFLNENVLENLKIQKKSLQEKIGTKHFIKKQIDDFNHL